MKMAMSMLLLASIATGLYLSMREKTNWENLKMSNIEALTSQEFEDYEEICTCAHGFCFFNGLQIRGISME